MGEPQFPSEDARPSRAEWLFVFVGALLPLLPVLRAPFRLVSGVPFSDVHKHIWGYWQVLESLRQGIWPWTNLIKAPCGGVLIDPMTLPALIMAPVTLSAGPALADNLWVGLSLFLVGATVMLLGRELGASGVAAAAAGFIAPSSPFLIGYPLDSGVRERIAVWLFPLLILTLLRLYRRPSLGLGLLSLLGLLVAVMGAQFYGFLAALLLPLVAFIGLGRRPGWRGLLRVTVWLGSVALLIAGIYFLTNWARVHPWSLITSTAPSSGKIPSFAYVDQWLGLLLNPIEAHAATARVLNDTLHQISYLGWLPLLAGGLAMVLPAPRETAPGRRFSSVLLLTLILFFGSLAVGPVFGRSGLNNPLYAVMGKLVPWEGHTERAWQDVAVVVPLLAIAAARLLDHLPPGRLRWAGALLGVGLVLLERGLVMPVPLWTETVDTTVPSIYDPILADPSPGLVIDVPRFRGKTDLSPGEPFIAQTVHGHPIPWGINPDGYDPVRRLEEAESIGRCSGGQWPQAARELRRLGIRWVVLHPDWCDPTVADAWVIDARDALGEPEMEKDGLIVFALNELSTETPPECSIPPAER